MEWTIRMSFRASIRVLSHKDKYKIVSAKFTQKLQQVVNPEVLFPRVILIIKTMFQLVVLEELPVIEWIKINQRLKLLS